jgi:hypothetical protein
MKGAGLSSFSKGLNCRELPLVAKIQDKRCQMGDESAFPTSGAAFADDDSAGLQQRRGFRNTTCLIAPQAFEMGLRCRLALQLARNALLQRQE